MVALSEDLAAIRERNFQIVRLSELVRWFRNGMSSASKGGLVALTCDDGGDFDFHDLPHPSHGPQRSVLNRLRDFQRLHPASSPHITSFVIVSPEARVELDKSCMVGRGWWNDDWWRQAVESGLMEIGSHSWDHNHDALPETFSHGVPRGTFGTITNRELADLEIRRSHEFLSRVAPNPGAKLFAYPYGESSEYLRTHYFPAFAPDLGIDAAFGDAPQYLAEGSDIWNLPRFICGRDWKSSDQLCDILDGAVGVG